MCRSDEWLDGRMTKGTTPWYWVSVSVELTGGREMEDRSQPLSHVWQGLGPSRAVPGAPALGHSLTHAQNKCSVTLGDGLWLDDLLTWN